MTRAFTVWLTGVVRHLEARGYLRSITDPAPSGSHETYEAHRDYEMLVERVAEHLYRQAMTHGADVGAGFLGPESFRDDAEAVIRGIALGHTAHKS